MWLSFPLSLCVSFSFFLSLVLTNFLYLSLSIQIFKFKCWFVVIPLNNSAIVLVVVFFYSSEREKKRIKLFDRVVASVVFADWRKIKNCHIEFFIWNIFFIIVFLFVPLPLSRSFCRSVFYSNFLSFFRQSNSVFLVFVFALSAVCFSLSFVWSFWFLFQFIGLFLFSFFWFSY